MITATKKQSSCDDDVDAQSTSSSPSFNDGNSDSYASTRQTTNTANKSNGSENVRQTLTGSDTKNVQRLRYITLLIMFVIAIGVSLLVFALENTTEMEEFQTQYTSAANKLISSFNSIVERAGSVSSMANVATISAYDQSQSDPSNRSWPFVTLTAFEKHASVARLISGALYVSMEPLVTNDERLEWEVYVTQDKNKQWIADGLKYSEYLRTNIFEHEPPPLDDVLMVNVTKKPITYHPTGEKQDESVIDNGLGPYLPKWQSGPVLMKLIINENNFREENVFTEVDQCVQNSVAVFGHMEYAPVGSIDHSNRKTAFFSTLESIAYGEEMTYEGDPMAKIYIPILDRFSSFQTTVNQSTVVGVLASVIHWNDYFQNILPATIHGLIAVLENTCDEYYSYSITGNESIPIGMGDLHDTKFQQYQRTTSFAEGGDVIHDGSINGLTVDQTICRYMLHIYPSQDFYDDYNTNMPMIISITVGICFLLLILMFIIYNRVVENRQTKVLDRAVHTTAIVSSLFPKEVRDRLIQEQKDVDVNGNLTKNNAFRNDKEKTADQKTIADLFLNCTVLFADITGFTAWSSTRDPDQVFTLLQTLFQGFDEIAQRRKVFKVETIGDSYVAVTGLPKPQANHAIIMARFAWECRQKMNDLMKQLEIQLGPDCSDLKMRFGLHSGPVVAGVLRGDRARFQLFGDTVNTASRMESLGVKDRIHISESTANLITKADKGHWISPREDAVEAKGKGILHTFWLKPTSHKGTSHASSDMGSSDGGNVSTSHNEIDNGTNSFKQSRLVDWMVEILSEHVKQITVRRISLGTAETTFSIQPHTAVESTHLIDEVKEVIQMVEYDSHIASEITKHADDVVLDIDIIRELREYVSIIATMYHDGNPFHNFQHACHVTMSVNKLLKRIAAPQLNFQESADNQSHNEMTDIGASLHTYTYGISSDPLALFAIVFSALIHDVDHRGCSNAQLSKEETHMASRYKNQSIAEQNSLDISWNLLMSDRFHCLRNSIFQCEEDLLRFRQILINVVLATDIFDKELNDLRKARWLKAFSQTAEIDVDQANRKATIVIEHVIQASDVAHTMQHWHVYVKWNSNLFREMYLAYLNGRMSVDPATFWYDGELAFFDNYVIPLANKLKECQVFGVSSAEYLNYANCNRAEWLEKGKGVVETYINQIETENLHKMHQSESRQ